MAKVVITVEDTDTGSVCSLEADPPFPKAADLADFTDAQIVGLEMLRAGQEFMSVLGGDPQIEKVVGVNDAGEEKTFTQP